MFWLSHRNKIYIFRKLNWNFKEKFWGWYTSMIQFSSILFSIHALVLCSLCGVWMSVLLRRRTPRSAVEEVAPEKLSQEAFRLLRTVQSLLGVQDPLAHRLTPVSDSESSRDNTWVRSSQRAMFPSHAAGQWAFFIFQSLLRNWS